jgi:DNA modification methylase
VKKIKNKAAMLRAAAKISKDKRLLADASEIQDRAVRTVGLLMKAQSKTVGLAKGGQPHQKKSTGGKNPPVATLAEAGIDKDLAKGARKRAALNDTKYEAMVEAWRDNMLADETSFAVGDIFRTEAAAKRAAKAAERKAKMKRRHVLPPDIQILQGDCRKVLPQLAEGSAHCCVCSPPYFNQRDYQARDQIGTEKTVEEYIGHLVDVFRGVRRVLCDAGTLWIVIGDSYAGKNLLGVPWLLALALKADGWFLRSSIIWEKPDVNPESVKDRVTNSHEHIFMLSKSEKYFFDADSIAEPSICIDDKRFNEGRFTQISKMEDSSRGFVTIHPTKNKRSVWRVATGRSDELHSAMFPEKLIEPMILAGCPVGGTVLDPFGGSGTTAIAAKRLGRSAVLIEVNPEYVAMSKARVCEQHQLEAAE